MWVIEVGKENQFTYQKKIDVSKNNIKKTSITDRLSSFSPLHFYKTIIGKIHAYHLKNMKAFMHMSIHHK